MFVSIPFVSAALPDIIWESSEENIITRGVTHEKLNKFTVDGWLSINILRIDLADNHISLDALYSRTALQDLTNVRVLAERQGAVAAVNGGYFEWNAGWGGTPIGTAMRNGAIDTAYAETNAFGEVMGSITMNALNEVLFAYCKPTIKLITADSAELYAEGYNKKSFYDYKNITILDRKWIRDSVGASPARPDIVELVVEGGVVREVRAGMPAIEIPVDGFVAVTRAVVGGGHPFSGPEFAPGSPVEFKVTLYPGLAGALWHIEGASMIVRDGIVPERFTFEPGNVSQRNPRTIIGCTEDGNELLLVTIDGRQATSVGLSSREAAGLMLELGAYNALSMDGGGSTTMVARAPGTNGLSIVNSVSDRSPRAVSNGIGVFTSAPRAAVRGLIIDTVDNYVFVGAHRQFTVRAYDRFYNPVDISQNDIVWSVIGLDGQIENGLLVPGDSGNGCVRAKVGRATAMIDVIALDTPAELILNSTSLDINPGESHTFVVVGRDEMGYSALLSPADISWNASDSFGEFSLGRFTRRNDATGYLAASYGDAVAYCAVQPVSGWHASGGGGPQASVKLPPATRMTDAANRPADMSAPGAGDAFRFGVLGDTGKPGGDAGGAVAPVGAAFADVVNKSLNAGLFVGHGAHRAVSAVTKDSAKTDEEFNFRLDFGGDRQIALIQLSSVGNGLRAAGKQQWGSFLSAMDSFHGDNLFIILQQGLSTFSDRQEANLFKEILVEYAAYGGYKTWVFYAGATDSMWIEDGVRYFTCAGAGSSAVNAATGAGAKYLVVTVIGSDVTYEYKSLF